MTRHTRIGISYAAALLLVVSVFVGCSNDPIFSVIEEEVELKDPSVKGTVTSLEVVDGNIFVANGYLSVKAGGTGGWDNVGLPSGAERCSEVASDGTYLYGRFTGSDHTEFHSVQRYDTATQTWAQVTGIDNIKLISSGNGRIYAFTGTEDSYNLYVTPTTGSLSFTESAVATGIATPAGTAGDYVATDACVYEYDGASLSEVGGSGASPKEVTGIAVNGANLYALNSGSVYRYNGSEWTSIKHSISSPTTGLAYLGGTSGKNLLLAASGDGGGGFSEIVLAEDGSLSSVIDTPGDSNLSSVDTDDSSQYKNSIGLRALYRIFAVTSAVPAGDSYVVYASVIHYTYDGLWAYYSNTQSEWNRE